MPDSPRPLPNARFRSPVVFTVLVALIAMLLWGAWMYRQSRSKAYFQQNSPANMTDQSDDTALRDVWSI